MRGLRVSRAQVLAFALTTGLLVALNASQGGYFPTSWGWSSAIVLLLVAVWLVAAETTELTPVESVQVGLLVLLLGWTFLSATWSGDPGSSVGEAQRTLVTLVMVAAVVLIVRRRDACAIPAAVLVAITLICIYATATRILPRHFGHFNAAAAYRLSAPIGYWNGLGLFAGMGVLLALGVVGSRIDRRTRAASAATLPITFVTLYFAYSRGSWLALALGAAVTVVCTRSIGRAAIAWLLTVPFAGAAVWYASSLDALTHRRATLSAAAAQGGRLAVFLVAAAAAAAAGALALDVLGRRVPLERIGRIVAVVLCALAAGAGGVWLAAHPGRPGEVLSHAKRVFGDSGTRTPVDLNRRLFSLSSNGRETLWRVAWDDFRSRPLLGSGAGTFERQWLRDPRATFYVRDAHSLYLETLAELGLPGLVLLVAALSMPLAVGARRTGNALWAGAAGAYVAYLVHVAGDWDWELSGVTSAAFLIGAAMLMAPRSERRRPLSLPPWGKAAAGLAIAVLLVFALDGWLGNSAVSSAQSAIDSRDWTRAEQQARRAEGFLPWSADPPTVLAEAYLGEGDRAGARASARKAIDRSFGSWEAWLDLALASNGAAQRRALAHAARLYPRGLEIAAARKRLAAVGPAGD